MISGFQASNIGQLGIEDFTFGSYSRPYSSGSYSAPDSVFSAPGAGSASPFFENPVLDAMGQIAAAFFDPSSFITAAELPTILYELARPEASIPLGASPGPTAVVPQTAYIPETEVIDPEFETTETVFEEEPYFEPENEWLARTPDTDWGRVYDQYVVLNQPEDQVFDWLESATALGQLGSAVGWWGGDPQASSVGPLPGAGASGTYGPMPATVTVNTRTGKVTKCKRRRRRKLLTESDFNVLLRVATLPNKENVRIVLGKAIGRSG